MSASSAEALQQYLRRLCERAAGPGDAVLLNRLVEANDRDAFEMLIARHGPMVLGSARRLVDTSHDAEDVFQAVFLSLARLAKTIHRGQTLPAWLHTATCRIAAKVRRSRPARSRPAPLAPRHEQNDPATGLAWQEVRQALDEELQRLPDRLRSPLVLCYLSGLTRDEAAKQLGWSLGTLKRRLEQGRETLRVRLERRGIAAVGLALSVLTPEALQAALSKSLVEAAISVCFSNGVVPVAVSRLVLDSAGALKGVVMKSTIALIVASAVGVGIYAGTGAGQDPPAAPFPQERTSMPPIGPEQNPIPKGDHDENTARWDDPLPAGSTLRFGSLRFRHGTRVATLAVSTDGKAAFVANDNYNHCRVFDLATGRVHFTVNFADVEAGVFSPDGRFIVVRQGGDLYVLNAVSGNQIRTIHGPRGNGQRDERWAGDILEFTPDGKAFAVTSQGKVVHLIDFETGRTIRDFVHENPESGLTASFSQVLAVAFAPDGKRMATGGYGNDKGNYFARLWDVDMGIELRRFLLGKQGYGARSLAFSPDGKTLATLGTQAGVVLRLFDADSGEQRKAFPKDSGVRPGRGSVAFAPDGKTVAAAGTSVRLYDTSTGEERLRIDRRASNLQFTDGGKTLTGAVDGAIYRWDTASGKTLTPEAGDSVVDQVLATPDGSRVITRGQDGYAHIWDGATAKHLRRIPTTSQSSLALSPDGRFLAWPVSDESARFTDPKEPSTIFSGTRIRLYDIAGDKFVDRFPAFKGSGQNLAFTADGKKLVITDGRPGTVRIYDIDAAEEERSFPIAMTLKDKPQVVTRTFLSPDGKTAVVNYQEYSRVERWGLRGPPQHTLLWDVATGTILPELGGGQLVHTAFSADGRLVLMANGTVWETGTGKQVAALGGDVYARAAAFSRDGKLLATTAGDVIQLWDTVAWSKRRQYKGHRDQVTTLTFTPAGQLLSGSVDTTVLAWDVKD